MNDSTSLTPSAKRRHQGQITPFRYTAVESTATSRSALSANPVQSMRVLLETLVRSLVDQEASVQVMTKSLAPGEAKTSTLFEVYVDPTDLGRVVGRQGRIARALRTFVQAAAGKHPEHQFQIAIMQ